MNGGRSEAKQFRLGLAVCQRSLFSPHATALSSNLVECRIDSLLDSNVGAVWNHARICAYEDMSKFRWIQPPKVPASQLRRDRRVRDSRCAKSSGSPN